MTDNELELFNQLTEDEGFIEAAEELETAVAVKEDPLTPFKWAISELIELGEAFDANRDGDEDYVSPMDIASILVENGYKDGLPIIAQLNDAIGTLSKLSQAIAYLAWHVEEEKK